VGGFGLSGATVARAAWTAFLKVTEPPFTTWAVTASRTAGLLACRQPARVRLDERKANHRGDDDRRE
jgi:hypothetical protein